MMYYYGDFGFHPFFGGIMMLLFWAVVIAGIVWLVRTLPHSNNSGATQSSRQSSSALDILKERYARGEIGKEEFDAKKKDLNE